MKKLIVIFVVFLLFGAGGFIWWKNGLMPLDPNNKQEVIFVVQKGMGVREIGYKLKKEELIKDPVVFFLLIKRLGYDEKIQAGDFRLSPSMTLNDIAKNLTHGTLDVWITVKEGQRADEIADILSENIPSYNESWRNILKKNEGYLFPDTYLIPKDAEISLVVSVMKNNFDKKYSEIEIKDKNFTKNESVILASLIEREAKFADDRPIVASVLLNRLDIGMPLQIDATVQYALGYQKDKKTWWKKDLTLDDLKVDSSYNTYLNPGLPPSAISNPGIEAIKAILNPAKTNYLYYISDKNGILHFAKTLKEHQNNIDKYGL